MLVFFLGVKGRLKVITKICQIVTKIWFFGECVIRFMPPTYTFMSFLEKVFQMNQNGSIKELKKKKKTLIG
jgi:hypothetical protein